MPEAYRGEAYTIVKAVFFANADADKQDQEIFILASQLTDIGPGAAEPTYETYVYDWNGKEFYSLRSLEKQLVGLNSAPAVKEKLKQLGL